MNTQYALKTLNQLRPVLIGFRKANGLTQKDVSERLGITQQTYARLSDQHCHVTPDNYKNTFFLL